MLLEVPVGLIARKAARSLTISWSPALKCVANRTKTPACQCQKDGNCSKRTFQGQLHVSDHMKGYVGDSEGIVVTCEDICTKALYTHMHTVQDFQSNFYNRTVLLFLFFAYRKGKWKVTENLEDEVVRLYSIFTCTVSTLKASFDTTLDSLQTISVLSWEMNFLSDWFSICFWQKKWVPKSNSNGSKSEYYKRCFNPNTNNSLDGPTYSGGFKLKKHGKIVGRLTCLSSLGTNALSLI